MTRDPLENAVQDRLQVRGQEAKRNGRVIVVRLDYRQSIVARHTGGVLNAGCGDEQLARSRSVEPPFPHFPGELRRPVSVVKNDQCLGVCQPTRRSANLGRLVFIGRIDPGKVKIKGGASPIFRSCGEPEREGSLADRRDVIDQCPAVRDHGFGDGSVDAQRWRLASE